MLLDPRDLTSTSQSLADIVNRFDKYYSSSPLPFCIRDQARCYIYSNAAYLKFIKPAPSKLPGAGFDVTTVEVILSAIELDAFLMGANAAMCRTFMRNGDLFQLRIETRHVQGEM
ncbi:hypothetical protein ACMV5I_28065 [Serratia sp. T13T92]|uniref:hypothetical protein n=1 Tax=unclassified Serratia (in: enterobacteria) TaxID=2647522 RepID=UPI001CBEC116|nr:hypothetical protein [Serratia sp. JSRIV006]UAN65801.1 hypothetical protein KGP16_27110 [Serratia sp. JSRIV006]